MYSFSFKMCFKKIIQRYINLSAYQPSTTIQGDHCNRYQTTNMDTFQGKWGPSATTVSKVSAFFYLGCYSHTVSAVVPSGLLQVFIFGTDLVILKLTLLFNPFCCRCPCQGR